MRTIERDPAPQDHTCLAAAKCAARLPLRCWARYSRLSHTEPDQTWPLNDPSIALDERGNPVAADGGTRHDILTGSNADGTVSASGTCDNWTSQEGTTRNGHSDRVRFNQNVPSWNSSHDTGCGEPTPGMNFQGGTVSAGGGRGSIYCFAID